MMCGLGFVCCKIWLQGMIRMLERAFYGLRGVTTKASAAFRAYDGRESFRFNRWECVNNDIFDPVSMVTRTAAVFVPFAWVWIELQEFVHYWVGHIFVPQLFPRIICTP